ncbi:1,6-anhydro-N-acetylmuramyl-L-alanine amidase AmpD [Facilibium subflavum]|uniref:1,6-anhydro-N-acetylmuramyl-L-alanine amidase AmpD n=1 Tax=Facilibium subflavum TaxID=2219058 RepID=UPI000E657077|nr:1,6-anhydro-N-acetylmuramyl-L-alanine amidase AmpD [Facilibium subflavum]
MGCEKFNKEGWYLAARKLASPNYNMRPDSCDIRLLVIHCISLPEGKYDQNNVEDFFLNQLDINQDESFADIENLKVSSHFYIKRNGQIIQFVSTLNRAWHAGKSTYKGRENCNDFSIGIELQGTDHTDFTERQYQQLIQLSNDLIAQFPALKDNIVGHSDIAPDRKTDPGVKFDWVYYRQRLIA